MTTGSPTCAESPSFCVRAATETNGHVASESPPPDDSDTNDGVESSYVCSGLAHNYEAFVPPAIPLWNWKDTGQGSKVQGNRNSVNRHAESPTDPYSRVCMFHNACIRDGRLALFIPPDAVHPDAGGDDVYVYDRNNDKSHGLNDRYYNGGPSIMFSPLSFTALGETMLYTSPNWWESSWAPTVVRTEIPDDYIFDDSAPLYFVQTHSNPANIGHLITDEYFGAYAAMELFDAVTSAAQMILMKPCTFAPSACARGYNASMRGLSLHPAKLLDSYASGTCFRRVIMGHSMAFGAAVSSTFRGPIARRFRDFFTRNLGLEWMYTQRLRQHFILVVRKKAGGEVSQVWSHVCDYAAVFQAIFPSVKVACVDGLAEQSLTSQVQMFAAATVIVSPHGGMLHLTNYARNGASVLILVDHGELAKDLHMTAKGFPWLSAWVLNRHHEHKITSIIFAAVKAASFRMGIAQPAAVLDALDGSV